MKTENREIMMLEKDIFISENESVKEALKKLDKVEEKVLMVVDSDRKLLGTITDGDIRRFILKSGNVEGIVQELYNKNPIFVKKEDYSLEEAKEILFKRAKLLPILDREQKVMDYVTRRQFLYSHPTANVSLENKGIPVIIMAGGKSTRLEPFNKIFPKPLIPIGEKPIIQIIIDEFIKHGIREYYLVLNYKREMIESYFNNTEKDYQIKYIRETDFLGTAGGLKLLQDAVNDIFISSNCDVIVKANFEEVVAFHKEHDASVTILSSFQHYKIPYGIVKFEEKGKVVDILEKPEYTFAVNTGVYVLDKKVLEFIPENSFFDMTDLLKILIKNKHKIFTYPVNENDYVDVGRWEEYKKAVEKLKGAI